MLQDYSDATVCVVDHGWYADVATSLTQWFGRVLLHIPVASPWPTSAQYSLGSGLPSMQQLPGQAYHGLVGNGMAGVEKIDDPRLMLDEIDLFIFPDTYQAEMQLDLRQRGKRVFGSGLGEELELDREALKDLLQQANLPVGPYEIVVGVEALRRRLKAGPGVVKISRTRGDGETLVSVDYDLVEDAILEMEHKMGAALAQSMRFIVEDMLPVDQMTEIGYDGICIDGQFTDGFVGIETKDRCYVCKFLPYGRMPEPLLRMNGGLAAALKAVQYRNFLSTEVLVAKPTPGSTGPQDAYLIDPCCRWGNPPGAMMQHLFGSTLPDVLWYGAEGQVVQPRSSGRWGVQLLITSAWGKDHWSMLKYPPEIRNRLFFHYPAVLHGRTYTAPAGYDNPTVCSVIGLGDSMQSAMDEAGEIAKLVQGYCLNVPHEGMVQAAEELEKLPDFGIHLGE